MINFKDTCDQVVQYQKKEPVFMQRGVGEYLNKGAFTIYRIIVSHVWFVAVLQVNELNKYYTNQLEKYCGLKPFSQL